MTVSQVPKDFIAWDDHTEYDQNLKRDTKYVPVFKKRHLSPRKEENKEVSNGKNNIMNKIAKAHESKLATIKNK